MTEKTTDAKRIKELQAELRISRGSEQELREILSRTREERKELKARGSKLGTILASHAEDLLVEWFYIRHRLQSIEQQMRRLGYRSPKIQLNEEWQDPESLWIKEDR